MSIRVKFGSSKEKITTRRMYIYLIPDANIFTTEFVKEPKILIKLNFVLVLMIIFFIL